MRFYETELHGAWLVDLDPSHDDRGFFSRIFCTKEFAAQGLETNFVQHNVSFSASRGTLRGMHFQAPPHGEVKVVECVRGAVWDVIIDVRPQSPSFGRWKSVELTAENRRQLYIPVGFAHGFVTLSDDAEVRYLISSFYEPSAASGFRHDDPAFAISWPVPITVISDKDRGWPDFSTTFDHKLLRRRMPFPHQTDGSIP
jgi:dTDP-4-dehydrorhamnose 3,5-epimerase